MFTKQHYKAIAKILLDNAPDVTTRAGLAVDFGRYFQQDNPAFDWGKWMKACEVLYREA